MSMPSSTYDVLRRAVAVKRNIILFDLLRTADVRQIQVRAGGVGRDRLHVAAGRKRVQIVARQSCVVRGVLDVNRRATRPSTVTVSLTAPGFSVASTGAV